ncbi:MAG: aspartate-semialdehyde dehydrogenase [Nanoarchaeota archaeon]|nr:aspartate-semialdehyde dehydrogenase [Nanoarchaeota archaeon]
MRSKLRVGILGSTGAVGQNYALLLEGHPWFEITYLAASPQSAGRAYGEAVAAKWHMNRDLPQKLSGIIVKDANSVQNALDNCDFVFSSYEGPKEEIKKAEEAYAAAGLPVISNNSAHRFTEDVPMIIPEVNAGHVNLIESQRARRGWERGFIVTKPNCSIQSFMTPLHALMEKGYDPTLLVVATEQALSGAGFPGVPSLAIGDNIVPYIPGEEEKTEREPLKILGRIKDGKIEDCQRLKISATCTRVPVRDGHTAIVHVKFGENKPSLENILEAWDDFKGIPQGLMLPSAPIMPLIYRAEPDRPQPIKDRDSEKGMAVTVGRLRACDVLDYKFVGLSHNTLRGAAGGAILTAELLVKKGYLTSK